jgi:epsilon-lactone hydrolase
MPTTTHPITDADRTAMLATRQFLASMPPLALSPEARPFYDAMIGQMPSPVGVRYESAQLGGVPGWWCHLDGAPKNTAILYLHGGAYLLGSAAAYRHTVGQFAASAGVNAFALDYRLAPEHPFPAAVHDAVAAYDALVAQGFTRIAIAGDSAGGGLTLSVLAVVNARTVAPVAAVAVSPWTDLSVSGASMTTRASHDPMLTSEKMVAAASQYLAGADAKDPRASPLFSDVAGLPPVLIHVGNDEVLLDDSVRYAEWAERSGGNVQLHVWEGMIHVFTASITSLEAARTAMADIGAFLGKHLVGAAHA